MHEKRKNEVGMIKYIDESNPHSEGLEQRADQ